MSFSPESLVGKKIDRYEVLELIGQGGMGTIYRVRYPRIARPLAMKVLRSNPERADELKARFELEARMLGKISHAHCVSVVDYGQAPTGELYIVMELLDGTAVSELLGRPLAVSMALEIVRQLLLALAEVHRAGVVHRDIKPDNVMLVDEPSREGRLMVKLFDFGLSRVEGDDRRLTRANFVCGTPTYLAPEQLMGLGADARSDLYSVGVMLFGMLTGRRPFLGSSTVTMLKNKRHRRALALEEVAPGLFSPELQQLIARALSRDPQCRFQDAESFLEALTSIQRAPGCGLATESLLSRLGRLPRALGSSVGRKAAAVGATVAGATAALAAAIRLSF